MCKMSDELDLIQPQTLPGLEGALNPLDEAQLRSAQARAIFEASEQAAPWMDDYWTLVAEGWTWRQAVYMLWAALPRKSRRPATQEALAVEVLGLTSDRVIREWKAENPAFDARIAKLVSRALAHARPAIYQALIESASKPNPRAHSDRRLALEMLGDYEPKQRVNLGTDLPSDTSEASEADLRAAAALPGGRELPPPASKDASPPVGGSEGGRDE